MDKPTLSRLLTQLPEDATEIIIKGLDTDEVFFCSDYDCSDYARIAQKGAYKGKKKRWRLKDSRPPELAQSTAINMDEIPQADTGGDNADAAEGTGSV